MAGSPIKAARRQAAAEGIPDAIEDDPNARAHNARPRARPPAPARSGERPGPAARSFADKRAAAQLEALDGALAATQTARIERLRPPWASGWVEDMELDLANLAELREYVRDFHGGHTYRITILHPDGTPMQEHRLAIAGPPMEDGQPITRANWNGAGSAAQGAPQQPPAQTGSSMGDMLSLWQMVMKESRESRAATQETVAAMADAHRKQQAELLATIAESREQAHASTSLASQLEGLTRDAKALEKVRDDLGAGGGEAPGDSLKDHATKKFLDMFADEFTASNRAPKPNGGPPRPAQGRPRPTNGRRAGPIPDAS